MDEYKKFVSEQIDAIDRMLFNAYGTTYKIAAKYLVQKNCMICLDEMEELLLVKTLVTNLWSILDYCCILYSTKNTETRPNPVDARNICVPISFEGRRKKNGPGVCDELFEDLQYRVKSNKMETFYQLPFST